ncbi:DegV family protein [Mycoplasma phocoeninasale]|uniref:DegV family EDD domain-containing protein n=1 Tax=Mycoplasma phocoeninasale TaxID=2726117 RepID=A0A858U5R2_9MOLU|nr:DegV family protein [Mycoplasma phocoeninasale]MBN0970748.1 DegV family protein [Mycoplasma phocoeninasale]QJG66605.1 DegV family EDD domain-containing protein [Mycoplasma phocoeninasale]
MKIKIILDSSAGLSKEAANDFGWELLPIQSEIDKKIYQNGVDMNVDKFEEIWNANKKVEALTYATPPGISESIVNKYLDDYDKIIIYGISTELSSQVANLTQLFQNNDKVFVVQSKKISYLIVRDLLLFEESLKNGDSFEKAIEIFSQPHERLLVIPKYNDALVKGGRLSKTAAAIAKLLKIVPIIKLENGILEKDSIGRVFLKSIEKQIKDIYDKVDKNDSEIHLIFIHSNSNDLDYLVPKAQEITENKFKIMTVKTSTDIAIHAGIGAICLTFAKIKKSIQDKFHKIGKLY